MQFRGWRLKACLQVLQGSFAKGLLPAAVAVANFCKEKPSAEYDLLSSSHCQTWLGHSKRKPYFDYDVTCHLIHGL